MSTRAERSARIAEGALDHEVVRFAADAMNTDADDAIVPHARTAQSITARLEKLGVTDELVSAVLALTQFAFMLRTTGSADAADAVLAAIRAVSTSVEEAIAALPEDDPLAGALGKATGAKLAAFRGDRAPVFEQKAPQANEVKATHARLALHANTSKSPKTPKKKAPR